MENFSPAVIFDHLLRIEKELTDLRQLLLKNHGTAVAKRHPGSLRGVWQGVTLEDNAFAEAKAALFPDQDWESRG